MYFLKKIKLTKFNKYKVPIPISPIIVQYVFRPSFRQLISIIIIQEIHSKNEQNPTMQPGTKVQNLSILEKYTDMQNITVEINKGKGIIFSVSVSINIFLQPPIPSGSGASKGHFW